MGRCNGYRPKAAVRKEVMQLRARLAECREEQWVRAGMIMDSITALLEESGGPMGGKINPRSCKYCRYYGHTRQWCKKRIADEAAQEEREIEAMLREDKERFEKNAEVEVDRPPYDPTKSGQALVRGVLGSLFRGR